MAISQRCAVSANGTQAQRRASSRAIMDWILAGMAAVVTAVIRPRCGRFKPGTFMTTRSGRSGIIHGERRPVGSGHRADDAAEMRPERGGAGKAAPLCHLLNWQPGFLQ